MDLNFFNLGGVATGIGSLPFTDPEKAVAFVFKHLADIPHWPQMPRRGSQEHLVFQFLAPLVETGLLKTNIDTWLFDLSQPDWPDRLTAFYTTCLAAEAGDPAAIQLFLPPEPAASGFYRFIDYLKQADTDKIRFVKGQIAGPLTCGLELKDQEGRFSYYHEELRDVIVRTLALNARSQAALLSQFGRPAIIFVDEPAISRYGTRYHLAMSKEMILGDMNAICRSVRSKNALVGVHCCQAIDWSILFETEMQILSLDAYRFGDSLISYSAHIGGFTQGGGVIAWGIVPTLDDPFEETPETLFERLQTLVSKLAHQGVDPEILRKQSMITPACGTGLLSVEKTERIYELTSQVSYLWRD
jgi:hypothetical protein